MRRLRIGDLFEVRTAKGFAYFQFCHRDPHKNGMGPLVRVMEGLFRQRVEPAEVLKGRTLFWTYFPLGGAVHHNLVKFIANLPVPPEAQAYPSLRSTMGTDKGLVLNWAISTWDEARGVKSVRTTRVLTPDEEALSWDASANFSTLVAWIEEQWRPESDPMMLRSQRHWVEVMRREKHGAVAG